MKIEQLAINLDQQSTLAKLLAQENIHVIHGNYRTAWFNPSQRVLALPIWKNRGKAVYDLLTGHEVGHALYTPADGWHDAVTDIKGAPRAYLNVLEDVRIERKIQDKFPGLRAQFQRGYKVLADENFFGTENIQDFSKLLVIDRINLFSKIGTHINVAFSSPEQVMVDAAYKTETFDDVVELAKKIYAYQKKVNADAKKKAKNAQQPPKPKQPKPQQVEDDAIEVEEDFGDQNDYEKPEEEVTQQTTDDSPAEELKPSEEETEEDLPQVKSSNEKSKEELPDDVDTTPEIEEDRVEETDEDMLDALESMTDNAFRNSEDSLLATQELGKAAVYTLNKLRQPDIVIDYKEYFAQWRLEINNALIGSPHITDQLKALKPNYTKFKNETEMASAYMAKEFEMRKAAYQYSRATVHKTGTLNTNKLHSYKTAEDIFLRSTKLANYQNHGMIMYVDFSGSMQSCMGPTIRQLLNLTLFCRMVNIPFEVYAFTTRVRSDTHNDTENDLKKFMDCEIIPHKFNLINLLSSRMSRKEYQTSQELLWNLSQAWDGKLSRYYIGRWNQLHSTPLNTCIAYADEMIKKFKAKHNVEKMTAMFLTDGESDSFQVRVTDEADQYRHAGDSSDSYYRSRKAIIRSNGRTIVAPALDSREITSQMLHNLGQTTGSTVLGFFISEYRNEAISKICDAKGYINKDKYATQMNNNRCLIEDKVFGYDRYFGLCSKFMDVTEDELGNLVEDGANKGKLKTAFAKLAKSKRVNRILLNGFVDAIA